MSNSEWCGIEIKKETFKLFNEEQKSEVLFDFMDVVVRKLNRLENKSRFNKYWSALGGVVGGALAALGIRII